MFLPDFPFLFWEESVIRNIAMILHIYQSERPGIENTVLELLRDFDLLPMAQTPVQFLSRGQIYKAGLVGLLAVNPEVWLLDEPFAGVDPIAVHDIQTIVAGLRHRGIGVLITDHNVEQTLDIVDRAYIMFEGKVQASGTVRELVYDDRVAQLYLGPTLTARLRARLEAVA